jgi:putative PIN family toxin of toxin-antitoxin system
MRVVLDTSVFVSMALGGQVGKINAAWKEGKFTLIVSDAILSEYLDVLSRPKLHLTADTVSLVTARVQRRAKFVTPAESVHAIESDPSDNKFLEAAIAGKAVYVVSGDSHLLDLKTFRGISILAAREFIERLGKTEPE